ncbi:uncharacterized protein Tco025E_03033 [Trypanosoma conorhini]|uniref:Uncharacterized protein n=1 Tax=Trypanosoma conorhini TaxID=83891 RepID=A0A422PYU8_9TRYP|nr:uncharacterized protein Tco025E_03033 [Trypanosoma conorhini]RNF22896.1 hypothetical protein Tco025E_03033 [Trypanosoma conorhini]
MNYDATPNALEPFGVLHGDRLVGAVGTSFEGKAATVLGVRVGCLLLRQEGEEKEMPLHGVEGKDGLLALFGKLPAPQFDGQAMKEGHPPEGEKTTSSPPLGGDDEVENDSNAGHSDAGAAAGEGEVASAGADDDSRPFLASEEAALAAAEEQWEGSESTRSDGETAPQSLFFTSFLKAVAYWKMRLLSEEEQRQKPLAFVEYYSTDAQRRMLEAVDLLQRHKGLFDGNAAGRGVDAQLRSAASQQAEEERPARVHRIVQLLVESEISEVR